MNQELHERLGKIIDLLDALLDEEALSDEDFLTLNTSLHGMNDVYDAYDETSLPAWATEPVDEFDYEFDYEF